MEKRVTIYDIANYLGVSTATVNRAINGKPKVREETRQMVLKTAQKMGFRVNRVAKSLARKPMRIGVLVSASIPDFINEVVRGARVACEELADFNVTGDFFITEKPNCRQEFMEKLTEMSKEPYDGVILIPNTDTRGYQDIIKEMVKRNIVPITVVTDDIKDSERAFSVRTNGRLAGKMAAELLWWFTKGEPVAIFTGNKEIGIHRETIEGFMEGLKDKPMDLVAIFENQDDPDIAYIATEKLVREYPDIKGLYINSSNSATVCRKITEMGVKGKIKIVASDIFPELKRYIEEGVVQATIFQDAYSQGRLAFKCLYEHIAEGKKFEEHILIKPQIVLRSNLELFI